MPLKDMWKDWRNKRLLERTAPEGPTSSPQQPELTDERGNVAFSPGGEAVVRSDLAGAFAVMDARHKPLPPAGNPKAVFIPNGTSGLVRGVAATTVMVEFPAPVGLVHVRKVDLWNPQVAEMRRRWAEEA